MQIDFSKNVDGTGSEPVKPVETTQTVNTPAGDAIACRNTHTEVARQDNSLLLGDNVPTLAEIILPRLTLVHSVGKLKDQFPAGSFVYDTRVVLYTAPTIDASKGVVTRAGTPPVLITFLGFRPQDYIEKIQGGGGQVCKSENEVSAVGGTLNWNEYEQKKADGIRLFQYRANGFVAIERPESVEDDDTVFSFPVGGVKYALALFSMKGSAFTVAKKTVFPARTLGVCNKGYPTHSWQLSATLKPTPDGKSTYWLPVLVPGKKSTPEFLEFASSVLSAKTVETPDVE